MLTGEEPMQVSNCSDWELSTALAALSDAGLPASAVDEVILGNVPGARRESGKIDRACYRNSGPGCRPHDRPAMQQWPRCASAGPGDDRRWKRGRRACRWCRKLLTQEFSRNRRTKMFLTVVSSARPRSRRGRIGTPTWPRLPTGWRAN